MSDGFNLINDNQQLHIEEVKEQHSGRYSCVAENVPGRTEKDIVLSLLSRKIPQSFFKKNSFFRSARSARIA